MNARSVELHQESRSYVSEIGPTSTDANNVRQAVQVLGRTLTAPRDFRPLLIPAHVANVIPHWVRSKSEIFLTSASVNGASGVVLE